ncbi:MAG: L,D-transpeptidase [Candidatus Portnoybacteria bacterium]|nr:L,D-transpeptidase [Candidatus Portnoybacteria bacterium]
MKKLYIIAAVVGFGVIGFGIYVFADNLSFWEIFDRNQKALEEKKNVFLGFEEEDILPSVMPESASAEVKAEDPKGEKEPPIQTPAIKNPEFVLSETAAKKLIDVDLGEQMLRYYDNGVEVGSFLISSGVPGMSTPKGEYRIQFKRPAVLYKGADYYFPNTKWNLQFMTHYYIHGAYWHDNFGQRMSHGCVNVSYANMEGLYNWAEVGVKLVIHD